MLGIELVAEGGSAPRQQMACPQMGEAAPAHPVADQGALILSDRPTNLQQQLVVRVLPHGPLNKLDAAAMRLEFLNEHGLVHVLARQPIWRSYDHALELGQRRPVAQLVAQLVEPWSTQARSAVASIAEDGVLIYRFSLAGDVSPQPLQRLLDGLRLGLPAGGDAGVEGNAHQLPPAEGRGSLGSLAPRPSTAAGVDTPDPIGSERRCVGSSGVGCSMCACGSSVPPAARTDPRLWRDTRDTGRSRNGWRDQLKDNIA